MKDKRSLEVKILHYRGFIVPTKEVYRSALKNLIQVIDENYDEMLSLGLKSKERNNYIEQLIHKQKITLFLNMNGLMKNILKCQVILEEM